MTCVYIAGRAPAGASVALETLALRAPSLVASSCAALCRLTLSLGGEAALRRLASDSFVSLLRGYGDPQQRLGLARAFLARLKIHKHALLSDLASTSSLCQCAYLVFSTDCLSLRAYRGDSAEPPLQLCELIASLCSLAPVPLSQARASLMDAEVVFPAEVLASLLTPLFAVLPLAQASWMESLPPPLHRPLQLLTLNDRVLSRRPASVPIFRICCRAQGFFGQFSAALSGATLASRRQLAATLLLFHLACYLEVCGGRGRLLGLLGGPLGERPRP